jgi:hypothetical protein
VAFFFVFFYSSWRCCCALLSLLLLLRGVVEWQRDTKWLRGRISKLSERRRGGEGKKTRARESARGGRGLYLSRRLFSQKQQHKLFRSPHPCPGGASGGAPPRSTSWRLWSAAPRCRPCPLARQTRAPRHRPGSRSRGGGGAAAARHSPPRRAGSCPRGPPRRPWRRRGWRWRRRGCRKKACARRRGGEGVRKNPSHGRAANCPSRAGRT